MRHRVRARYRPEPATGWAHQSPHQSRAQPSRDDGDGVPGGSRSADSAKLLRLELPGHHLPGMQVVIPTRARHPRRWNSSSFVRSRRRSRRSPASRRSRRRRVPTAQFTVRFNWDRDAEKAAFEVRTKLDSIRSELPAAADRILMFSFSASDEPVTVIRLSSDADLTDQYDTLEKFLKRPIERLEGVARVELEGVEPNEVRVLVDPTRVAACGVDVLKLRELLEESNFSVSAGEIPRTAHASSSPVGGSTRSTTCKTDHRRRRPRWGRRDLNSSPRVTIGRRMTGDPRSHRRLQSTQAKGRRRRSG